MTDVLGKFLLLMVLGMAVLAGTACNTMEGAGEDVQRGGEEIEDAAD